jgi:hypothetical protein
MKILLPVWCALLATSSLALACNIPVFRYALERWRPDKLEILVFHDGSPRAEATDRHLLPGNDANSGADRRAVGVWNNDLLEELSASANLDIKLVDVSAPLSEDSAEIWSGLGKTQPLEAPFLVLRGRHTRGSFTCWSGTFEEVPSLLQSPARIELARRLLSGHSIVWLVMLSEDAEKNRPLLESLRSECDRLAGTLELPEGIGLPGSELYAEVPLFLKFSILEIERGDAGESFLWRLCEGFQPEAFVDGEPLVIPVFGRGRALEVIPASRLNESLIENITMFLCGACSCQVKDQNPGFDLLVATDWEQQLYGETGLAAPPASSIRPLEAVRGTQNQPPVLLTIPPGKSK